MKKKALIDFRRIETTHGKLNYVLLSNHKPNLGGIADKFDENIVHFKAKIELLPTPNF